MQANVAHQVEVSQGFFQFLAGDIVELESVDELGLLGRYEADDGTTGPQDDDVGIQARVDSLRIENFGFNDEPQAGILLLTCTTFEPRPRRLVLADYEVRFVSR